MTHFIDGPAAGQVLALRSSPEWLRVVQGPKGWDGLDQPGDTPALEERVYLYRVAERLGHAHIRMDRRRGASGFYPITNYRIVEPQPADDVLRSQRAYREWIEAQP